MTAVLCTALSAIGFYFSIGMGDQWWLAWLAPVPVLWLAFGDTRWATAFGASFLATALGMCNILGAYAGLLPVSVLVPAIGTTALLFSLSAMWARRIARAFGPVAALFAFAALWSALEFFAAFDKGGGSVATVAASQVGMPMLIQTASLASYLGITFLLGACAAGIALGLRTRKAGPALIAVALFGLNAGFGYWRLATPPTHTMRVALVESDDTVGSFRTDDEAATMKAIAAYADAIASLRGKGVELIVLPENISRVAPSWRAQAEE